MKIYVDFDDCLCETARHFSGLVKELFGKDVPYESWNQESEFPGKNYRRCFDWDTIKNLCRREIRSDEN